MKPACPSNPTKVILIISTLFLSLTFCGFELPESSGEADEKCLAECDSDYQRRVRMCKEKYPNQDSYEICIADAESRADRCDRACEM